MTLSGTLSGTGNLSLNNPGTLILTSNSSGYTATTTVTSGTLLVNGTLGGPVFVDNAFPGADATLGGTGTVLTATVNAAGGTVAPGESPGVLVGGSLTFTNSIRFSRWSSTARLWAAATTGRLSMEA